MSASDAILSSPLKPDFPISRFISEPPITQHLITTLNLQKHPEGGYYAETDRDTRRVPNPFALFDPNHPSQPTKSASSHDGSTRSASTTIYYMITPGSPQGSFHRNKGRTVHTLHKGRGCYVLIHSDEVRAGQKARVETFVVGHDVEKGERLQWIVDGGKYKASFLLSDRAGRSVQSDGLLVSETVVPGFEFEDHDFLESRMFEELVTPTQREELKWLLRGSD